MDFWEMLETVGISQRAFWTALIFLSSLFIEWRPEIKWNPWTALFKWIGSRFNKQIDNKLEEVRGAIQALDKKVESLQTEVGKVQGDLTDHIKESEIKSLQDTRRDILDFANTHEDILDAFQPFYQETSLEQEVNVDLIYQTERELLDYAIALRTMTQARGVFEMEFSKYEEVPSNIAQKIIEDYKKEQEAK